MSYAILAVRTANDDDGSVFPVIGADHELIELEKWDGTPRRFTASAVSAQEARGGALNTLARFRDVKIEVQVTDARVVLACKKWTKGGGWFGFGGAGIAVALVADAVSSARAARRRHGKLLMGQVRYAWLSSIGYHPRAGFGSSEQLRLGVVEHLANGGGRNIYLDLTLPKDVDSAAIAQEIVKRAAQYRLVHTPLDPSVRQKFEALRGGYPADSASNPKTFTMFTLPDAQPVSKATAYPSHHGTPAPTGESG